MPVLKIHVVFPDHQIQRQWNSKQCVTNATICNMLLCGCVPVCEFQSGWRGACVGHKTIWGVRSLLPPHLKQGFLLFATECTQQGYEIPFQSPISPWKCLDCRCDLPCHHGSAWIAGVTSYFTMGVLEWQVWPPISPWECLDYKCVLSYLALQGYWESKQRLSWQAYCAISQPLFPLEEWKNAKKKFNLLNLNVALF